MGNSCQSGTVPDEAEAMPTVAFALGVVEHPTEKQWVLVHEKDTRGWWIPGGGVDAGQLFAEAMEREAEEEAGCNVSLQGILRIEHTPAGRGMRSERLRIMYLAAPQEPGAPLKTVPDVESKGAEWASIQKMLAIAERKAAVEDCHLRGMEPMEWFGYRAMGGQAAPLSFLHQERVGELPPHEGEAPRAFYPTTKRVGVGLLHGDCMWLPQAPSNPYVDLPQVAAEEQAHVVRSLRRWPLAAREGFNQAAARVCGDVGVRLHGIHRVYHYLDVRGEEEAHCAEMSVIYLAQLDDQSLFEEVAARLGCVDGPHAAMAHPLSMIACEGDPVMLNGTVCEHEVKARRDEL